MNVVFLCCTFPLKIKDCQVIQARISREHGGRDHKTELQVGGVEETQLYKVMRVNDLSSFLGHVCSGIQARCSAWVTQHFSCLFLVFLLPVKKEVWCWWEMCLVCWESILF